MRREECRARPTAGLSSQRPCTGPSEPGGRTTRVRHHKESTDLLGPTPLPRVKGEGFRVKDEGLRVWVKG